MKHSLAVWCLVLCLALTPPVFAGVTATLDTQQVAAGDTVELTLHHDGHSSAQPDLTPLKQDFDVLSTQTGSSIQITNGGMSASTQVVVTLAPKNTGRVTIPSLTWGQDRTLPLTLEVLAAGSDQAGGSATQAQAAAPVFLETQVDSHRPYVQAAVDVTVRLYFSEALHQASLTLPQSADDVVMQVGQDTQSSAERNGQPYQVVTRHYTIFPQRSGEIQLPGPTLGAQVEKRSRNGGGPFGGFFGSLLNQTRPLRLHGDPIALSVQPRPADAGSVWIPARNVQLSAQWKPTSLQVHAGDPVTVELQLQADGLTAEQLPDLTSEWTLPQGLRAYPDQPKLDNLTQGTTVLGKRTQSVALIADDAGQFSIPDLRLRWWDVTANASREVTLPGKTLTVLPAAAGSVLQQPSPATAQAPATPAKSAPARTNSVTVPAGDSIWRWLAFGFGALWITTISAWLWSRRASKREVTPAITTQTSPPDVSAVRSAFREACQKGDALAARRNLLAWVTADRNGAGPVGLNALARESTDSLLAGLLRDLDRACFLGTPWNGEPLERALRKLPQQGGTQGDRKTGLAPLYPR
ncbi:MAG: protein BatD [Sinobacteraceae bacterium]|nr:protein BatD [Nevskiaceae bacterium]